MASAPRPQLSSAPGESGIPTGLAPKGQPPVAAKPKGPAVALVVKAFRGRDPATNRTITYKVGDEIRDAAFAAYQHRHGRAEMIADAKPAPAAAPAKPRPARANPSQ